VKPHGSDVANRLTLVDARPALRKKVRQRTSHRRLIRDISGIQAPRQLSGRAQLDAIIVPHARPVRHLDTAAQLAADLECLLVALCSRQADVDDAARRLARVPGCRALVVDVPAGYRHDHLQFETSEYEAFRRSSADRDSDISVKRNLGLLIARLLGWQRIMFLDDDITRVDPGDVAKLAGQLERHQIAGFVPREFPDNSVVCHANRWAGHPQDVFVSGSALGVNCRDGATPFFPDIYNEDWFFFYEKAADRGLLQVGEAYQLEYDPFEDSGRAAREEFGDLLAEGLFALLGDGHDLAAATKVYWQEFYDARQELLTVIEKRMCDLGDRNAYRILTSIVAAKDQLELITPDLCVQFLDSWRRDRQAWDSMVVELPRVGKAQDALDLLELKRWRATEFGSTDVTTAPVPDERGGSQWERHVSSSYPSGRVPRLLLTEPPSISTRSSHL
jgi:hypothetical protein